MAALAAGLLAPAPAPVAAAPVWQDAACYSDPSGDTVDTADGSPGSGAEADIFAWCATYEAPADGAEPLLELRADIVSAVDPTILPNWESEDTALTAEVDTDGDPGTTGDGVVVRYALEDGELTATATHRDDGAFACEGDARWEQRVEEGVDTFDGTYVVAGIPGSCLDDATAVTVTVTMSFDGSGSIEQDVTDPSGSIPAAPRQCPGPDDAFVPGEITTFRVACGIGGTEAITQAIAFSHYSWNPSAASWVVLARNDDYADALAGSALAFGLGPLLFTHSPASAGPAGADPERLAPNTLTELQRVLPAGGTVYLMGGVAAIAGGVETQLTGLGYQVVRFAGASREETAVLAAAEVRRVVEDFAANTEFPDLRSVIVTTRGNWPDAVVAGAVAALWGFPVLLTPPDSLHPATRAYLETLQPEQIYVIGGTAAIATPVREQLEPLAVGVDGRAYCTLDDGRIVNACRVGGATRVLTALGIGELARFLLGQHPDLPFSNPDATYGIAVNLFRGDAFAHALAATTPAAQGGGAVFIPLEGDAGTAIGEDTRVWLRDCLPELDNLILAGDRDLVSDDAAQMIRNELLEPTEPGAAEGLFCRPPE